VGRKQNSAEDWPTNENAQKNDCIFFFFFFRDQAAMQMWTKFGIGFPNLTEGTMKEAVGAEGV
jgi:hypothetical protein